MSKNIQKLEDMIDYNNETINKIVIAENDEQKAVLFALKKHQEMPSHSSSLDAFVYVIEGEVDFVFKEGGELSCDSCSCSFTEVENKIYTVKKGEFFNFEKDTQHSVIAKKDTKMLVVRI